MQGSGTELRAQLLTVSRRPGKAESRGPIRVWLLTLDSPLLGCPPQCDIPRQWICPSTSRRHVQLDSLVVLQRAEQLREILPPHRIAFALSIRIKLSGFLSSCFASSGKPMVAFT